MGMSHQIFKCVDAAGRVSVDELAFDIEDEGGVGWDVGGSALRPVGHGGG